MDFCKEEEKSKIDSDKLSIQINSHKIIEFEYMLRDLRTHIDEASYRCNRMEKCKHYL